MKFKTLEDKVKGKLYEIIVKNLEEIYPEFKEKDDDYEKWEKNCENNDLIVFFEDKKPYAHLMYIDNYICEIQISMNHRSDGITLKNLLKEYSEILNNDAVIGCYINPFNTSSIKKFTYIGFKLVKNNKYKITKNDLDKWIYKVKENV